jgi:hypothetical protein
VGDDRCRVLVADVMRVKFCMVSLLTSIPQPRAVQPRKNAVRFPEEQRAFINQQESMSGISPRGSSMGPQRRSLHAEIDRAPFGDGPVARPSDECEEETCASLVSHEGLCVMGN